MGQTEATPKNLREVPMASLELSADIIRGLKDITHAASTDEPRPSLCGVELVVLKDHLRVTATDRHILVRRFFLIEVPKEVVGLSVVVDATELAKAAGVILWAKSDKPVGLTFGDGFASLEWSRGVWKLSEVTSAFPGKSIEDIISGVTPADVGRVVIDPRQLEKVARALGVWPDRRQGFRLIFNGEHKPVRVVSKYSKSDDLAMFMPMSWYD